MANQLNSLKTIHELQKEGVISEVLRKVRTARSDVDLFAKRLLERKKAIEEESVRAAAKAVVVEEAKPEKVSAEVRKERPTEKAFSNGQNSKNNFRTFDPNSQNRNPRFQNGQNGQFNRQNGNNNGFRRDGANSRFAQGQRPNGGFGNNRPQNGQKRPGNFVSTKVNNFRSFASNDLPELEVKTDRNFAQKTKNAQKHNSYNGDERKANVKRQQNDSKRVTFFEDEDGIQEISYGSRKNVIKKKKENVVVAPAVTHAALTSKEVTVKEFSEKIGKPVTEIVKKLMMLGIMATINSNIDYDTAELIASDFGITLELKVDKSFEEKLIESAAEEDKSALIKRPPVVTVMGHVDHGKTSLLDAFRKTDVVSGEAGGITQKIGAYQIEFNGEKITFIDTPGHAAFTAMRARGAKSTDVAILVVAADDGIMPQTVEAINHIKAAGVPMIVAINKMDKMEANPDRVKQQLTEHGVLPEEWGGDAICVPISAKTGMGLDELKQTILLVAEVQELKANPDKMATGVVIEAELDKNRGPVATILVQNGTLRVGDSIMTGITYGKVRAMFNDAGKPVKVAPPSTPVSVLGLGEVPFSGDQVYAVEETLSKNVIQERIDKIKKERAMQSSGVTLDNFMNAVHEGSLKNLNIILKADSMGSVEAVKNALLVIRNEEAKVNIVHSGAGAVTESDVILAQTTGSIIISFNLKPVSKAMILAEKLKVQVKDYKIIYEAVDDVTAAISGMMSIKYQEVYIGFAEIRVVFKLSTAGKVAGSYVKDGKITRNAIAKIKRGEEEIGVTSIESLKIVKDEKAEVAKGFECGIKLRDNIDFKEGDIIECFIKEPIKR